MSDESTKSLIKIQNRDVVASGSILLKGEDRAAFVKVSDLELTILFEGDGWGKLDVIPQIVSPTSLRLRLENFNNPLGTFYTAQMGALENRELHVSIAVFSTAVPAGEPPQPRLLHYTFSLGEVIGGQ